MMTSVALSIPRSVRMDLISASRMARPRKWSGVPETTVGVALSPETLAPSQYRSSTLFQLLISGFTFC